MGQEIQGEGKGCVRVRTCKKREGKEREECRGRSLGEQWNCRCHFLGPGRISLVKRLRMSLNRGKLLRMLY